MDKGLSSLRLNFCPRSLVQSLGVEYGLVKVQNGIKLAILAHLGSPILDEFEGETSVYEDRILAICPLSKSNAANLRKHLPWLRPQLLGSRTSAGMGDRLGIATPGHVRAVRATHGMVAPVFAQQSIREMKRTSRTPQQVMDDAMWGVFEEGWQDGFGADADHLKTKKDIDVCLAAGFTLFTVDPGEYVDNDIDSANSEEIKYRLLESSPHTQLKATGLLNKTINIEKYCLSFDEQVLSIAISKYGKAIEHIVAMYQYLEKTSSGQPFEVEISMDETAQPTSPAEHAYIASELHRRGVKWISFAPRFIGRFEKGVEYIGDLQMLENQLAIHAAIARHFGPYKLSLHSGSDKFSIYPMLMYQTQGLAHLKTAGTSYLEALRTIARLDVELFKEIYDFALARFESDKLSYHVTAQIDKAPKPDQVSDWPGLLEIFDAREILHVTFGSVLTEEKDDGSKIFYDRLMYALRTNREMYFDNLMKHFKRHLELFAAPREALEVSV